MAEETTTESEGTTEGGDLSLLDKIIQNGKMARDESQRDAAKDLIGEFVKQILDEGMTVSSDTVAMIVERIAQIDELITKQLNEICMQKNFRS